MLDVARISLVGDMELLVENHRGVVEYRSERIALVVPNGQIAIAGEGLSISSISRDQVLILGRIRSIHYVD